MYPGPSAPDLGVFVRGLEEQLIARGHDVRRAVLDSRRRGKRKYLELARDTYTGARHFEPDVVYAHFLVPTGLIGALVGGAPLVVTAHGRDVRNVGWLPGIGAATRFVVRRAAAVVAVSDYLRRELEAKIPEARGKTEVVDSGVDLERFHAADGGEARRRLGVDDRGPVYLCVGTLDERKNVVALADAFERLDRGQLIFVGDGPLRARVEGRPRVSVIGRVPHAEIPAWIAASDVVCQPSLEEPFGQAILEAMACERPVVATSVGGPPEFVTADAGVLVDPYSVESIREGLERAAALPSPNAAARAAAAEHDVRIQAVRVADLLASAVADSRAETTSPGSRMSRP
jgi:glycosyltransferase involved in cell wall biosynthesis